MSRSLARLTSSKTPVRYLTALSLEFNDPGILMPFFDV